jgi:hypothetical protein
MRGLLPVLRRGVALLILVLLLAPAALADDNTTLPPPPEARIGVPIGAASTDEPPTVWELFVVWLQARIGVPIG